MWFISQHKKKVEIEMTLNRLLLLYLNVMQYNTIQYNELYLKSENIKHYNTMSF